MLINFLHKNHNCSAFVSYRDRQEYLITVYILDFNSELGYEIIFKKNAMNVWATNESIIIKFPSTYYSLCLGLTNLFPGNNFISNNELEVDEFAA